MGQPLGYRGYRYDAALGWYWLSVRPYDPVSHRFLQPDPSGQEGVRSYAYCGDDPIDCADPTGLAGQLGGELGGGADLAGLGSASAGAESATGTADSLGLATAGAADANALADPVSGAGTTTDPLLLPAAPRMTRNLRQIQNMPSGQARGAAGEQFVSELYDNSPREVTHPMEVPSLGSRRTDVLYANTSGTKQALEVKTYSLWRTVQGASQLHEVPLTSEIRLQIDKDTYLRARTSGFEPKWVFLDAPPSQDLLDLLDARGFPSVIYGQAPRIRP